MQGGNEKVVRKFTNLIPRSGALATLELSKQAEDLVARGYRSGRLDSPPPHHRIGSLASPPSVRDAVKTVEQRAERKGWNWEFEFMTSASAAFPTARAVVPSTATQLRPGPRPRWRSDESCSTGSFSGLGLCLMTHLSGLLGSSEVPRAYMSGL